VNGSRRTGPVAHHDFATVAYNAATGTQRWVARYNETSNGWDAGGSVAITPDGRTVTVAGPSFGKFHDMYQFPFGQQLRVVHGPGGTLELEPGPAAKIGGPGGVAPGGPG